LGLNFLMIRQVIYNMTNTERQKNFTTAAFHEYHSQSDDKTTNQSRSFAHLKHDAGNWIVRLSFGLGRIKMPHRRILFFTLRQSIQKTLILGKNFLNLEKTLQIGYA
ncbi:MAG: hypothetical protein ACRC2T_11395, partial [Thermoguttaceae bacterium]